MPGSWRRVLEARFRAWVLRRQGPDHLPLTLERRRIYILPTRPGAAFAALLFLMLLAGIRGAVNSLMAEILEDHIRLQITHPARGFGSQTSLTTVGARAHSSKMTIQSSSNR